MATTQQKTDIKTNQDATTPPVRNSRAGYVYYQPFSHTQSGAGDDGSDVTIWTIPAGCRIIPHLSTLRFSAFGAARVMQIGHKAYTDSDGATIAANLNAFVSAIDVSAAGFKHWIEGTLGDGMDANHTRLFKRPADLIVTVTGGTWPDLATIVGLIAYMPVGS